MRHLSRTLRYAIQQAVVGAGDRLAVERKGFETFLRFVIAHRNLYRKADVVERIMIGTHAVKRMIEPDEVAAMVVYMCSEAAGMVTGAALTMDGGWTAR